MTDVYIGGRRPKPSARLGSAPPVHRGAVCRVGALQSGDAELLAYSRAAARARRTLRIRARPELRAAGLRRSPIAMVPGSRDSHHRARAVTQSPAEKGSIALPCSVVR